ncbi:isochorismate synthase [Thiorhodococcus mannitoliphagus]|uniref:isochorismate synthase n=1 Tax=Thiorhodococcus mannitoliphagus TaxID=329406 RepID=A0A6P1DWP5_9GAMM|nr:isochorismate synthase [Thiorhodococcus mannitoliphagus]NEX22608.1 isochorismate synthase [Thiorhodococcus mannitoliphagus]
MLQQLQALEQLKARLRETISSLALGPGPGYASLVLELPHGLTAAPEIAGPRFQFLHAHRGDLRVGYGVAAEWLAEGPQRLEILRGHARAAAARWQQSDPDETGFTGFGLLGFAASPTPKPGSDAGDLPNAVFWLPELALTSHGGQAALILTTATDVDQHWLLGHWEAWLERVVPLLDAPASDPLTPAHLNPGDSEPDLEDWRELVFSALDEIDAERLEKVVLCRRLRLRGHRRFDLTRLSAALGYLFPSCQVLSIRRDQDNFVAATPERLFTQHRDRIEADAIAGTACRAEDSEVDAQITAGLQTCEKNLREHRVVVEAVNEALSHCCRHLDPPDGPRILQLNNAQHLWSLVRGELKPGVDVFELADRLHPTPATNGQPRREAWAWLRAHEPIERGWYTGAAGIVAPDLTGELWVLLRCARIQDRVAELYAGAGIVAGSDPLSEWQETEHKLAAMSTALQFA